jgi:hypothetical protein
MWTGYTENVTFTGGRVFLHVCLLFAMATRILAQVQPQAQPPAQPPQQPAQQAEQQQTAPQPPPKPATEERPWDTSDGAFSFSLFYWLNPGHPVMRTGKLSPVGANWDLNFPGKNRPTPGAMLGIPLGRYHTLRLSYFRTQGRGGTVATHDSFFFGTSFSKGDVLSARYTLMNGKISLDYVSWPFPVGDRRLRIKTLWEVQYTSIRSTIDAPLKGTTDSDGNFVDTRGFGQNWFIYPSLGMGLEAFLTRHFRWELKGSGFAIPHHSTIWDAESFFAYRGGKLEVMFGGKAFHFKTSPKRENYVHDTLPGAFVGLRWYP